MPLHPNNYNDDLQIDEHNLEHEWEAQSGLYMKWAEAHANAIFDRDKKKAKLDVEYSEVDNIIRDDPTHFFGDTRPTEAMVKAKILQSPRYKRAMEDYLRAVKTANIMQAAKESMHSRRKALENLTQLFLGGYYSEPRISNDIRRSTREVESRRAEREQNESLRGNRRLRRIRRKST